MNKNIWKGKWMQLKGEIQSKWGDLTNDELDKIEGDREKIQGLIKEKYGIREEEIKKSLDEIEEKYLDSDYAPQQTEEKDNETNEDTENK